MLMKLIFKMKTATTKEQKIENLEKRIKELNVFLKKETDNSKVRKLHEDISKLRDRIKQLKFE